MWLPYGILGAISLALVNSFFKSNPWGWSTLMLLLVMVVPTTFGTQYGFLKLYQNAPSFMVGWFIGTGMTAVAGFLASIFIFREQVQCLNIAGIGLILMGSWLLMK